MDFQFHSRHVLLAMVLLSLALAPVRHLLPVEDITTLHLDSKLWVFLQAIVICNLVIAVLCIWGAFLDAKLLIPLAFGWLIYCGFLSAVELSLLGVILSSPVDGEVMFYLFTLIVAHCAAVFVPLLIFCALGVGLLRVKRLLFKQDESQPWVRLVLRRLP